MARRKSSAEHQQRVIKTSVSFGVADLARIKAAAALSGLSMSRYIEEAALEATRGLIVIDKRKGAGQGDPSARVKDRTPAVADLDDPEGEGDRQAA